MVQVDDLPRYLNPLVTHDLWCMRIALGAVFEPLVMENAAGGVRPHLAAKVHTLRSGRQFLFELRDGVTFHDGRPLTPTDVKYTLDILRGKRSPSSRLRQALSLVKTVRVAGRSGVEVTLRRPNNLLLPLLAEVPVVPAHLYARRGIRNGELNAEPVGTGPYKVAGRKGKHTLVLEANEAYWGTHARLKTVEIREVRDPSAALAALRNGELDVISNLYHGYFPKEVRRPRVRRRYRVLRLHPYRLRLAVFNTRRSPTRDPRVRRAVVHLADRQRMVRTIRNGMGKLVSGPMWSLGQWYNRTLHPYVFDRKAAGRLLDAAGWRKGRGSTWRTRGGHPLTIGLLVSRESMEMRQAAQVLARELGRQGVKAPIEVGDFGYVEARLSRGKFDVALVGLGLNQEPDLHTYLHSEGADNHAGWSSPAADNLLVSLRLAERPEQRLPLARRVHRLVHKELPWAVLWAPIELMVVDRRLHGLANNGRWPRWVTLWYDR